MPVRVATHPERDKTQARPERIPEVVSARGTPPWPTRSAVVGSSDMTR